MTGARAGRPRLSVVFSFRNEAENLPALLARIIPVATAVSDDWDLVFVNDASNDASYDILRAARETHPQIRILTTSRRFGVGECMLAGFAAAAGDVVVYMDADLQDPPEVIPQMIERWRAGADVVHTVRERRRGEGWLKTRLTRFAYRVIRLGASIDLPVEAGDFKLLSRRVVDQVVRFGETDPYIRGIVASVGFPQDFVPYERQPRHRGQSHFPWFSRGPWKTLATGLTSFSFLPLYLILAAGLLGLALAAGAAAWAVVADVAGHPVGAALWVALVAFLWGSLMTALGTVALYLSRIAKDVRGRPRYIIDAARSTEGPGG
jgi:glycosyltransferase involved in cell wall biosynthesis